MHSYKLLFAAFVAAGAVLLGLFARASAQE